MARPDIFELDFLEIFNAAVDDFQGKTGYTLERQDAERLMLQIFADMVFKWGSDWLEASAQNYLEYMTGAQLDAYGENNEVDRLASTPSKTVERIHFVGALEVFYTIHKNTSFTGQNDNGTFTYKVLEDAIAVPEATYIDVPIEEYLADGGNSGELSNKIEIGDINSLDDPDGIYSIIDSVENLQETYGGHASESDDHYKNRLRYVLGQPSTAGAFDSYKFHSLSAHVGVLDVGILKPAWEIKIYCLPFNFESEVIGDPLNQIDNVRCTGLTTTDTDQGRLYWDITGTPTRTVTFYLDPAKTIAVAQYVGANGVDVLASNLPGHTVRVVFDLTGSTDDTDALNYLETFAIPMCAINQIMNPSTGTSKVRPLNDIVSVYMSQETTFTISKLEILILSGNVETVETQAAQVVNAWRDSLRGGAGLEAIRGDLESLIRQIGGIHTVDIELNSDPALKVVPNTQDKYLTCALPTIAVGVYVP